MQALTTESKIPETQQNVFPFQIVNIRPEYPEEKAAMLEQNIQTELFQVFKKYYK